MIETLINIRDSYQGKIPKRTKRSSKWRKVRAAWLETHPRCCVCDGNKKIEVHHIVPFHVRPDLELDDRNLATVCERKKYGINCHLLIGHLGRYRGANKDFRRDALNMGTKLIEGKLK